ncbi:MAG: AAA family ATPase, partial [Chloroflexi bacterium]
IEIQDRQRLLIHHSVASSVDGLLRGQPSQAELRYRDPGGEICKEQTTPPSLEERESGQANAGPSFIPQPTVQEPLEPLRVYPYGIARNRLERAARRMRVPVYMTKGLGQAEVLLTTKSFYRKRPRLVADAEQRGLPVYVLRANTVAQMEACLSDVFDLESRPSDALRQALQEVEGAIRQVQGGIPEVTLSPQNSYIRRRQHEMARTANLASESRGKEPHRRVRIFREE